MVERKDPQQDPEHIYSVGEWFNPFQNYEYLPKADTRREYGSNVDSTFEIKGIGVFTGSLMWPADDREAGVVLTQFSSSIVPKHEVKSAEERISARLLSPWFALGQKLTAHQIELKMGEDGEIYSGTFKYYDFADMQSSITNKWSTITGIEKGLYIPERNYILDEVEVRVVPIPNGKVMEGRV